MLLKVFDIQLLIFLSFLSKKLRFMVAQSYQHEWGNFEPPLYFV